MPSEGQPTFRVGHLESAIAAIRALRGRAIEVSATREFRRALQVMMDNLEHRPLDWGDPLHRTRKTGGLVCQAVAAPLVVHYVVFEEERRVCILNVQAFSES